MLNIIKILSHFNRKRSSVLKHSHKRSGFGKPDVCQSGKANAQIQPAKEIKR